MCAHATASPPPRANALPTADAPRGTAPRPIRPPVAAAASPSGPAPIRPRSPPPRPRSAAPGPSPTRARHAQREQTDAAAAKAAGGLSATLFPSSPATPPAHTATPIPPSRSFACRGARLLSPQRPPPRPHEEGSPTAATTRAAAQHDDPHARPPHLPHHQTRRSTHAPLAAAGRHAAAPHRSPPAPRTPQGPTPRHPKRRLPPLPPFLRIPRSSPPTAAATPQWSMPDWILIGLHPYREDTEQIAQSKDIVWVSERFLRGSRACHRAVTQSCRKSLIRRRFWPSQHAFWGVFSP